MFMKIAQAAGMYMLMQFAMKQFMPKAQTTSTVTDAEGNTVQVPANTGNVPLYQLRPDRLDDGAIYSQIPRRSLPYGRRTASWTSS